LKKLEAEYAHFKTVLDMCNKLIYEYNFGFTAIKTLYNLAKRHGEPIKVLEAIEKYGELKNLEKRNQ